jgi:hypothetical protein
LLFGKQIAPPAFCSRKFANVLIKFFTSGIENENNKGTKQTEVAMLKEITEILNRSPKAMLIDAVGVVSLFAMLFAGLGLSSSF